MARTQDLIDNIPGVWRKGVTEAAGKAHGRHCRAQILDPEREAELLRRVDESKRRPTEIEAADDEDFDTCLTRYFARWESIRTNVGG